jgi:RNA polymerase sigma factor (sigma-70 family)
LCFTVINSGLMNYKALISDHGVFEAFRNGDERAFSKIYAAFKKPVYITTLKIVGSPEDAEDATVQAFMRAWERRDSVQSFQHLKDLIFIIARNICLNILRSKNNKAFPLTDEISEEADCSRYSKAHADQIFADLVHDIHTAIERLPKVRREVFRLRYMEEMSPDEVADALEMNVQNVYAHTKRAMRELREALGKGKLLPSESLLIAFALSISTTLACAF